VKRTVRTKHHFALTLQAPDERQVSHEAVIQHALQPESASRGEGGAGSPSAGSDAAGLPQSYAAEQVQSWSQYHAPPWAGLNCILYIHTWQVYVKSFPCDIDTARMHSVVECASIRLSLMCVLCHQHRHLCFCSCMPVLLYMHASM